VPRTNAGVGVVIARGSGKDEEFLRPNADVSVIALENSREQTGGDNSEPTATMPLSGADALLMAAWSLTSVTL
jgi:hypothetical protein